MNIWNDFNMKKPPYLTLPSTESKFVLQLHAVIDAYVQEVITHDENLNKAAALLSRLMAKRKNSFRHMYGFKWISKLNSALCRLLRLDFKKDLNDFHYSLPDVAYKDGTKVQLPSRDCFDYLLIRLFALNKLYDRIGECCVEAGKYFVSQVRMNLFFEISTLLLAVVAKIQNATAIYNNLSISLYNKLHEFREKFPVNTKSKYSIVDLYQLPEKLHQSVNESTNELPDVPAAPLYNTKDTFTSNIKRFKRTDVGCVVERDNKNEMSVINIDDLNSVEVVEQFIITENERRSVNIKNCATKNIQQHEWLGVTRLFQKKIRNNERKIALNVFTKFLKSKVK